MSTSTSPDGYPSKALDTLDFRDALSPLSALHRGQDGYIAFARKSHKTNGFENLFSLTIEELEAMFPAIANWLISDAYFTVNGMYRAAPFRSKVTGLPGVWRAERYLRYLNACYVDLDFYKILGSDGRALTWRDAVAVLGNMMDDGLLPQSSIFAHSGRGIYVFWALHDEDDPALPPRAWPERLTLYKAINKAVTERLQCLAGDRNATDAARLLRVPGTTHSTNGKAAIYQVQHDGNGRPFSYTLQELAAFFGVHDLRISLPDATRKVAIGEIQSGGTSGQSRPITNPGSAPLRRNGPQARHARCAQDLVTVEQSRGGWRKGQRRFLLGLYADFLRGSGSDPHEVLAALQVMADNCQPAYPSDSNDSKLQNIVVEAFTGTIKKYRTERLVNWLGITAEVAGHLDLLIIVPAEVKEERRLPPGGYQGQMRQARHEFTSAYVQQHGFRYWI